MDYHFKSPQQLQEELESTRQKVHPFRNRTFLFIFADIILIVIIFVVARFLMDHYGIDFDGYSTSRVNRYGLEFSGVYAPASTPEQKSEEADSANEQARAQKAGSSTASNEKSDKAYVRIRNRTDSPMEFPAENGPFSRVRGRFILERSRGHTHDRQARPTYRLAFEKRTIQPGEVELYSFVLNNPVMASDSRDSGFAASSQQTAQKKSESWWASVLAGSQPEAPPVRFQLVLDFSDGHIILAFPRQTQSPDANTETGSIKRNP